MKSTQLFVRYGVVLGLLLLTSCGGGGGGGLSGGPSANVNILVDPNHIDSGDRTEVAVQIASVREDAVAIKIRFPLGLSYVTGTAYYLIDGIEIASNPTEIESDSTYSYLVFYLNADGLGHSGSGTLFLELEGVSDITDDVIEVDVDLDDPTEDNRTEFDIDDPQFDAQDQDSIRVGSSSSSTSSSSSSSSSGS